MDVDIKTNMMSFWCLIWKYVDISDMMVFGCVMQLNGFKHDAAWVFGSN